MDTQAFLSHLRNQTWYQDQVVHTEDILPRQASYGHLTHPLSAEIEDLLKQNGLWPLYSHQVRAIESLQAGENVIVATATASGKSLCYHIPVLEAVTKSRGARALYIFPTKALAQDQLRKLRDFGDALPGGLPCDTYDGDTPNQNRGAIRRSARVILTNPDMLHLAILPNHRMWRSFLSRLEYVVFDEAHVYRGVFGSHVANVIRRLRRICAHYGAHPKFVLCSATIANPKEHAETLVGLPFTPVQEDGSPYGGKDFLFWNPPFLDDGRIARRSPNTEAAFTFAELVSKGIRTITFSRSRKLAELIYIYVRDRLKEESVPLSKRVRPYRAGYLPEDRREIEQALFRGELLGVSATNALELGIDIGGLDATIINGYPGTIASTWQQAGRSGRGGERSLSILIASDNPLDQYLMRHPEAFFGKSQEHALISPTNPYVLGPHLLCAAYEAPLTDADQAIFGDEILPLQAQLERQGLLHHARDRWFPSTELSYPASETNIRSTSAAFFQVIEEGTGAVLETVDSAVAFSQIHPGAVYLHKGDPYLIVRLDIEGRTAWARLHAEPYYTVTRELTDIKVLSLASQRVLHGAEVCLGTVDVSRTVVGFKRKRQLTEEVIADELLDLPTQSFETVALWWEAPEAALAQIDRLKLDLAGGLHAAEHAAIGMLPLFAMCDRADIGGVSTPLHPDTGKPTIFIYDGHPGGIGIAEKGFDLIHELWLTTLRTIEECPCRGGCPSCIQSPKCGNNNNPLDKAAARLLLQRLTSG